MTVEARLRDALSARADALTPSDVEGDGPVPTDTAGVVGQSRRHTLLLAAAVIAVALIASAVILTASRDDRSQRVASGDNKGAGSILGDRELSYVFEKDDQIWGETLDGQQIQLTRGPRSYAPHMSPNGHTLVFSQEARDSMYDRVLPLDLTGSRGLPDDAIATSGAVAFAPNGDLAFSTPGDDSDQEVLVDVLDGRRHFRPISEATLGLSYPAGCGMECVGHVRSLAWDTDSRHVLVVAGGEVEPSPRTSGRQLWLIDTAPSEVGHASHIRDRNMSTQRLRFDGPEGGFVLGQAMAPDTYPAVATDPGVFGYVLVNRAAATARFVAAPYRLIGAPFSLPATDSAGHAVLSSSAIHWAAVRRVIELPHARPGGRTAPRPTSSQFDVIVVDDANAWSFRPPTGEAYILRIGSGLVDVVPSLPPSP